MDRPPRVLEVRLVKHHAHVAMAPHPPPQPAAEREVGAEHPERRRHVLEQDGGRRIEAIVEQLFAARPVDVVELDHVDAGLLDVLRRVCSALPCARTRARVRHRHLVAYRHQRSGYLRSVVADAP
jgi:hypothetical protein